MTDKIIEAARLAGFRTGAITLTDTTIEPIPFIAPVSATDCKNELARFYAIARAEALEDAANLCSHLVLSHPGNAAHTALQIEQAIRALKEQNAAIAAGKGEG